MLPVIRMKIEPIDEDYDLVFIGSWINNGKPFGLSFSNNTLSPLDESFSNLIPLVTPYLPDIIRVLESKEFQEDKYVVLPIQTDGWVN